VTEERLVERFLRESTAVQAHTVRVSRDEVVECLLGLLEGDQSVVAAAGLDGIVEELRSRGVQIVSDDGSGGVAQALPGADAGLCRALGGVAVSGTVLVGPGSGFEGLISILPPHCVILLSVDAIYPDLTAALAEAAPLITAGCRLAFVTGPSRTSDIELTSVIGVHGPLRLDVVVIDE
jgi:L-lactate dehydrogenase complex protein LldG